MEVIDWLLDGDPAIRWQVLRDLTEAPPDQVAAERARVETEGWGARLLAVRDPDGQGSSHLLKGGLGESGCCGGRRCRLGGIGGQRASSWE